MADKTLSELPEALELYDDSLLLVEQQGQAQNIRGGRVKSFAENALTKFIQGAGYLLTIGKVTTGAAGSEAKVTNSGTAQKPVLDFTIPRGATGAKGDKGEKGDEGPAGPQGAAGAKGADGVSPTVAISKSGTVTTVTITDAAGAHKATINDGAKGNTGPTGPAGPMGPQGPTGPQGPKGDTGGVTGVKGNAETGGYRTGNVNLTPGNIGALPVTGGTVSGHVAVLAKSGDSYVSVHNTDTDALVSLSAGTDGGVGVYSASFNQWLIKKNSDGSFSLCGVKGPFLQKEAAAAKVAHALTFTGAVTDSYDGSANKTVNIPEPSLYMEEIGGVHLMGASEKFDDLGSGMFRWTTALTDATKPYPSGVGIAVMQSENAGVQLVFALTTATLHVQIRRKRSGTWEAWQNVQLSAASADEPLPGPEIMAEDGQGAERIKNYE